MAFIGDENAGCAPAFLKKGNERAMTIKRRRFKHTQTFEERLAEEAERFRKAAEELPQGSTARELLLRRSRQAEAASHMSDWLRSPGLKPST